MARRKLNEILLAVRLEHEGDMPTEERKRRILCAYLNRIYLGEHASGVRKAASVFFDKELSELSIGECALLASLPTRPTAYNPYTHPDDNQRKRRIVLRNLLDQGCISADEYDEAIDTGIYERVRSSYRFSPHNRERFIGSIAGYVDECSRRYRIKVRSPIISQAILESEWGTSLLASRYGNYFGIKQGSDWTGETVSLSTTEMHVSDDSICSETVVESFRVYRSMRESVLDYLKFLDQPRYDNLAEIVDPRRYLTLLLEDGYSTDPDYVKSNMMVIDQFDLGRFDVETPSAGVRWGV